MQLWQMQVSPTWNRECLPVTESLQTKIEEPLWFPFLLRNKSNDILVQTLRNDLRMYISRKAELILLLCDLLYKFIILVLRHLFFVIKERENTQESKELEGVRRLKENTYLFSMLLYL